MSEFDVDIDSWGKKKPQGNSDDGNNKGTKTTTTKTKSIDEERIKQLESKLLTMEKEIESLKNKDNISYDITKKELYYTIIQRNIDRLMSRHNREINTYPNGAVAQDINTMKEIADIFKSK